MEFIKCLESSDFQLSKADINSIMVWADLNGDGVIQYDEVSALCLDIRHQKKSTSCPMGNLIYF
jgi:Ca2+-binding EF-hand superfamily protein